MKFDQVVPKDFYFKNLARFEKLKEEVLRLDWSDRKKGINDPPLIVGGAHHIQMKIENHPLEKDLFQIRFRIIDERGYKEIHPDLERMGRFFRRLFPEFRSA